MRKQPDNFKVLFYQICKNPPNLPDPRSIKSRFEFDVPNLSFPKIESQPTSHKCRRGDGAVGREADVVTVVKNILGSGEYLDVFVDAIGSSCINRSIRPQPKRVQVVLELIRRDASLDAKGPPRMWAKIHLKIKLLACDLRKIFADERRTSGKFSNSRVYK